MDFENSYMESIKGLKNMIPNMTNPTNPTKGASIITKVGGTIEVTEGNTSIVNVDAKSKLSIIDPPDILRYHLLLGVVLGGGGLR